MTIRPRKTIHSYRPGDIVLYEGYQYRVACKDDYWQRVVISNLVGDRILAHPEKLEILKRRKDET